MLVSNLQQFIRLLVPPLTASGINASAGKNVTSSLEALAAALEPFAGMSTDELTELLRAAEEYRRTGVLPAWVSNGKATPKAVKATKAPKLSPADAVAKLRDLQERPQSVDSAEIERAVEGLSGLTLKELQDVQRGFLGVTIGKTKNDALAALRKKIDDARASRERVQGILAY
ncbi:MAG: hypothetical protein P4L84_34320 [Isosphaeraceae bacterium]|nr:hypothetical protein [Isosphaeraceae bacterium]